MHTSKCVAVAFSVALSVTSADSADAEKRYGPGVTDTEIKIGQTMPYSGPVSAYGAVGRAQLAYFAKVNAEGGINGRKITLISLDDGYNPAKAVEAARRLIEQDNVLLLFSSAGTATNLATRKYLNAHRVPHLFVAGGDSAWADRSHFPWMIGWMPAYQVEASLYAKDILKTRPRARIGLLYAADDYGRDYAEGFKKALGDRAASMIVSEQTFQWSDPTVDSQIFALKASGADTLFSAMGGKHASQAIRRMVEIGWRPLHYTGVPSTSIKSILEPAGLGNATGLISAYYAKAHDDPSWKNDPAIKAYYAWAANHYDSNADDGIAAYGYQVAQALEYVLRRCGDDLTRENVMRVATSMRDVEFPMLLPGVRVNTSPTDYHPIEQFQMMRFNGKTWELIGGIVGF
jgi:branched-chain amino acid transport system substrate-binding protein